MSACYSVTLKVRLLDEQGAIKALQDKIARGPQECTCYCLDNFKAQGVGTDTFDDLVRIFLAGWKETPYGKTQDGDFTVYTNDFNASYGWECVMLDLMEELEHFVADGSFIRIYPDSGCDLGKIENGQLIWK